MIFRKNSLYSCGIHVRISKGIPAGSAETCGGILRLIPEEIPEKLVECHSFSISWISEGISDVFIKRPTEFLKEAQDAA